ncbi:peptide-binding protein [Rhodobacterales bacterium HKCCE2091]|nr:peptide-binding protein [Rhodobacterales bacterium HKCCE2091]
MARGETVTPGRLDDEYPGWRWVTNAAGLGGWVPADLLDGATVTADFDTTELSAAEGEAVTPLETRLGWIRALAADGREGWIPGSCLG